MLLTLPSFVSAQIYHIETIQETDGLPSPNIKSITQDRWGVVWTATRGGITFHNGLNWEKANLDSLGSDVSDGLLAVDPQGEVWALMTGNQPALFKHHFCSWEEIPLSPALKNSHHYIREFCPD